MKNPRIAVLIVVLISLYGCSSLGSANKASNPTREEVVAPGTVSPTANVSTRSPVMTKQTIETRQVPTSTPTMDQLDPIQNVEIQEDTPLCISSQSENDEIPGVLFYQKYEYKGLYAASGKSFQSTKNIIPSDNSLHVFGVSPDGKWLAYSPTLNGEDNKLQQVDPMIVLLGANGEKIEHSLNMDWPKKVDQDDYALDRFVGGYWLNDHLIFTYINSKIPETPSPLRPIQVGLYLPVIIDPFQGKIQTKPLDILLPIDGGNGYSISPNLRYVLSFDDGMNLKEITTPASYAVLWKAQKGRFTTITSMSWSPDGNWAVFSMVADVVEKPFRTILMSKNGGTVIELHNPLYEDFVKEFYWSPNSRYFAFVSYKSATLYDLLVFDVVNMQSILRCPFGVKDPDSFILDRLAWSPDSAWIAVSAYEAPFQIVEIRSRKATEFDIVGRVVGWSDQFTIKP